MQRDIGAWKLNETDYSAELINNNFTCDECGRSFEKPIMATVFGGGPVHSYYACPRCMTKVPNAKTSSEEEKSTPATRERKRHPDLEDNVNCEHFFGYLKKREKDMPIPEECLTCGKMVECLLR